MQVENLLFFFTVCKCPEALPTSRLSLTFPLAISTPVRLNSLHPSIASNHPVPNSDLVLKSPLQTAPGKTRGTHSILGGAGLQRCGNWIGKIRL